MRRCSNVVRVRASARTKPGVTKPEVLFRRCFDFVSATTKAVGSVITRARLELPLQRLNKTEGFVMPGLVLRLTERSSNKTEGFVLARTKASL